MIGREEAATLRLAKKLETVAHSEEWKAILQWIVGNELTAIEKMYEVYSAERFPANEDMALAAVNYCQARRLRENLMANMITATETRKAIVDEVYKTYAGLQGADRSTIEAALETE